ncbi:MAG TPA: acyltransferase [Opitutaceae bacterium]|nr:acyltransferase [Opitutaceae bacterium]
MSAANPRAADGSPIVPLPREAAPGDAASRFHAAFRRTSFFGCLDGLRALSILAVVWYHTMPYGHDLVAGQGFRGVTLFFVISGFLIVTLILRAKDAGSFSVPQFWGRRMFRIFPVYYAVLAAYVLLVWKVESDPAARAAFFANLPAFLTFTSNWLVDLDNARVIFYIAWSLAAEEQFYLVWPWVERWARGRAPLVVAGAVVLATQVAVLLLGPAARDALHWRILTSVPPAILLGVALAHVLHDPVLFRRAWAVVGRRGSASGAAVVALLAIAWSPGRGQAGDLAVAFAFTSLIAACVIREDNDLVAFLRLRWLAWIGTVSYGMYLMHMLAVNVVRRVAAAAGVEGPWVDFVGGTLLAVGVASLSFVTYERFFLRLKDRLLPARGGAPKVPAVAVPGAMGLKPEPGAA